MFMQFFFAGAGTRGANKVHYARCASGKYKCYNKICKLGFHISVFIGGKCSITFLKAKQASFGGRF